MATTTISGSGTRNDGGVILHSGINNLSSRFSTLTVMNTAKGVSTETGPIVDTNGAIKPYSAGTFCAQRAGQYIIRGVSTKISGVASTKVLITGADVERQPIASYRGDTRQHITSWNYITHAATYGGSRGANVTLADCAGGDLTIEPYPTKAIPGEFVYTMGSPNPVQADFPANNL